VSTRIQALSGVIKPALNRYSCLDEHLCRLDEAREYLGSSLTPADAFRLIASTARAVLPVKAISIFVLDESRKRLRLLRSDAADGEADQAELAQTALSATAIRSNGHRVAAPLRRGNNAFGVLHLGLTTSGSLIDSWTIEAIAGRAAALILAALAAEKTREFSKIDTLTQLPNERSFYEMVEQAAANRDPYYVIVADIVNFAEVNEIHGHIVGDELLRSVAGGLNSGIRDMDHLARAAADEFLILMPGSSTSEVATVLERLKRSVSDHPLKMSNGRSIPAEITFGWAELGHDGETPQQLLATARTRLARPEVPRPNIVAFPKFSK